MEEGEAGWASVAGSGHSLCSAHHSTLSTHQLSTFSAHPHPTRPARADSGPASPSPQASGPLAGAVRGLLQRVGHPGGIGGTEELYGAPLQAHLAAALAEAGVGVDVIVVDAGGRAPPITGH